MFRIDVMLIVLQAQTLKLNNTKLRRIVIYLYYLLYYYIFILSIIYIIYYLLYLFILYLYVLYGIIYTFKDIFSMSWKMCPKVSLMFMGFYYGSNNGKYHWVETKF